MPVKQVICMRKDLNMRRGKEMAQASHASMGVFFDMFKKKQQPSTDSPIVYEMELPPGDIGIGMSSWIEGIFKKIVCAVNSEEELLNIHKAAMEKGLPCKLIQDCGLTEFKGVPTYTCCAIGPAKSTLVDEVTKDLKLL